MTKQKQPQQPKPTMPPKSMTTPSPKPKQPKPKPYLSKVSSMDSGPYPGMDWRPSVPNIINPQGAIDYMRIINAARNQGK